MIDGSTNSSLGACLNFFESVLSTLRLGFAEIEKISPKPAMIERQGNIEYRFVEPSLALALVLKLARAISLLEGLRVLVERGLIQEQGILQRALDETHEDIFFLAYGDQLGTEPVHDAFLEAFWSEEFSDPNDVLNSARRDSIPRKKIQAYINRQDGVADPSSAQALSRTLYGVFSGYVHGASTHILDLYDPKKERFQISGLCGSAVRESYVHDAANYPYRILLGAIVVSRRLGLTAIAEGFELARPAAEKFIGLLNDDEADALFGKPLHERRFIDVLQ